MYNILVTSSYEELWRYNILVMCGGYDESEQKLYVVGKDDSVAEVGDLQICRPEGYAIPHRVELEAADCDYIRLIVYVVPNSVAQPKNEPVLEHLPFDLKINVKHEDEVIYNKIHEINQWGGASILLDLTRDIENS